jgi:hypothetical protein
MRSDAMRGNRSRVRQAGSACRSAPAGDRRACGSALNRLCKDRIAQAIIKALI